MKALLSLIFIFNFSSALACQNEDVDCLIDKQGWVKLFSVALPAYLCKEDSPILQCYEITQAKCIETTITVTQQCINDTAVPEKFKKADSSKWGEIIGSCAGGKLTDGLQLKKGKSDDCAIQQ